MGSIPVRVMNKIPDLRIRDFFMQPVRGIEGTRPPAGGKKEPSGLFFSVRVPTSRNVYRGCCTRKGVFNLTRTGIEQGGGAKHRNQSPSGALVSPGVPTARNVYRGCCTRKGFFNLTRTGIAAELTAASEQRLPPVGGRCRIATKRGVQGSEAGAVASPRVPTVKNVKKGQKPF